MKRYRKRTVVSDVSLAVESGEVVGLLGPNGAGKTTCFYMIVGLVPTDGGERDARRRGHHPSADLSGARAWACRTCRRRLRSSASSRWRRTSRRCSSCRGSRTRRSRRACEQLLDDLHIAHLRASPALIAVGRRAAARGDRAGAGDAARASSCWTSPSPASIPSRCSTSRRSSASSRSAASACSSPTTTCARRWASATAPTSSTRARCWPSASREEIIYNEAVRKVYLGENFRL